VLDGFVNKEGTRVQDSLFAMLNLCICQDISYVRVS